MSKKSVYVKPSLTVVDIKGNVLLAASGLKYTDKTVSQEHEALSAGRRNDWNDIWN